MIEVVSEEPIERFRQAAVRWAAGGRGQPLVDAAAQALVDGLDSPSLRMLAGAPAAAADEEAHSYAEDAFEELDLDIATRNSERAAVEGARQRASDFLAGGVSARELARSLYGAWVATGYADELADWSGFDDWYDMIATLWRGEHRLRVADAARTVIEVLDDPRLAGGIRLAAEILTAYLDEHPAPTLIEYGERIGNRTVFKRLGYLVERLQLAPQVILDECRERISTGVSLLDPDAPAVGERVSHWNLRANVTVQAEAPS